MRCRPIRFLPVAWITYLALGCSGDPPGDGFVVIQVNRMATAPGLSNVLLDAVRTDSLYVTPPDATGKAGADGGPGLSWVPRLDIQCDGLANDSVELPDGGMLPVTVDFTGSLVQPERVAVLSMPAGRVHEIRFLMDGGTTLLQSEDRPDFFVEHCDDVPSGGDGLGVIRVLPNDPNGFEVEAGRTTIVTINLDPNRDFIVTEQGNGEGRGNGNGSGNGQAIGQWKLFLKPNLYADWQLVPEGQEIVIPNEYFIGYKPGTTAQQIASVDANYHLTVVWSEPSTPSEWIHVNDQAAMQDVLSYYLGQSAVAWAEPVYRLALSSITPSDYQSANDGIRAASGWDVLRGSPEIEAAVVDTGIDLENADLVNNIAINQEEIPLCVKQWFAQNSPATSATAGSYQADPKVITFADLNDLENAGACSLCTGAAAPTHCSSGSPFTCDYNCDGHVTPSDLVDGKADAYGWQDGVDNDGDGLADDLVGWDFTKDPQGNLCGSGHAPTTAPSTICGNNLPTDTAGYGTAMAGHGTAVASLLGAVTNNGVGVAGTAWHVGLVPYKVADPVASAGGTQVQLFAAVLVAGKTHVPVINIGLSAAGFSSQSSIPKDCSSSANNVAKVPNGDLSKFAAQEQAIWSATNTGGALIVTSVPDCSIDVNAITTSGVYLVPASLKTRGFGNVLAVTSAKGNDATGYSPLYTKGSDLIDLAAVGEGVTPLGIVGSFTAPPVLSNCGGTCGGTSFAAPQIAGAAVDWMAHHPETIGQPAQVIKDLKNAARTPDPLDGAAGAGLLDLGKLANCPNTPWTITPGVTWPDACWRPFSDYSPVNRPLPDQVWTLPNWLAPNAYAVGAELVSEQAVDSSGNFLPGSGMLDTPNAAGAWLTAPSDGSGGWPTWYASTSDPSVTVQCQSLGCGPTCDACEAKNNPSDSWLQDIDGLDLNVPSVSTPQTGSDSHQTIIDFNSFFEWDFWQYQNPATTPIAGGATVMAANANRISVLGEGIYRDYDGTAAFMPNTAGRIRVEELMAGQINHAIAVTAICFNSGNSNVYPAGFGAETLCSSSHKLENLDANAPPLGGRLVYTVPASVIAGWNIAAWKKTVLIAMSKYGIILNDGSSDFGMQTEDGAMYKRFGANDPWYAFGQANGWNHCTPTAGSCNPDAYIGKLFTFTGDPTDQDYEDNVTFIKLQRNLALLKSCASQGGC